MDGKLAQGGPGRVLCQVKGTNGTTRGLTMGADHGFYAWNVPNPSTNQGTVQANPVGQVDAEEEFNPWQNLD